MAIAGVNVSIEAVHEHQIQEVALDGQETLISCVLLCSQSISLENKLYFEALAKLIWQEFNYLDKFLIRVIETLYLAHQRFHLFYSFYSSLCQGHHHKMSGIRHILEQDT